jgi:hypothetical protein
MDQETFVRLGITGFWGSADHILLSPIWDSPNLGGQVPVFIRTKGTGWPSYNPRHWVPFLSPPTTCRTTVEVFEAASTWSFAMFRQSRGLFIELCDTITKLTEGKRERKTRKKKKLIMHALTSFKLLKHSGYTRVSIATLCILLTGCTYGFRMILGINRD